MSWSPQLPMRSTWCMLEGSTAACELHTRALPRASCAHTRAFIATLRPPPLLVHLQLAHQ